MLNLIRTVQPTHLFILVILFYSCSSDETRIDPTVGLTRIADGYALGVGAKVEVWSERDFVAGYNPLYISLTDSISGDRIQEAHVHLNPIMDMHTMTHSCPVENPEEEAAKGLFEAAVMFTMPSGDMGSWTLEIKVHNHHADRFGTLVLPINVKSASPSQIVSFKSESGSKYYLAYSFPKSISVGVNQFEMIAFTFSDGEFVPAENMTFNLTPWMPSMDHGSPNNINPTHIGGGHYKGSVNFTMTGEWRLSLGLSDASANLGEKYFDVIVE